MIKDCLQSVKELADEIIIVDGESKDKTVEIAKKSGARVFVHPFKDFAAQRNFGLEKATGDWILYIDADERVTDSLRENIKYLPAGEAGQISNIKCENIVAFKIKRKNFYLGNHEWPYIEKLERLFRRDKLKGWYGELHESPTIHGEIGELDEYLLHFTHRDLSSMLAKTNEWSKIEAELRYNARHPQMAWWRFPRVMMSAFFDYYFKQGGWKVGTVGLIESLYQSFSSFITYAKLWEMQHETHS